VRLLLDTHALLWFAEGDDRLGDAASRAIQDRRNHVIVSIASYWELAIKSGLGRFRFAYSPAELLTRATSAGFDLLPLAIEHVEAVRSLALLHRDPFDRILIAQAITTGSTLVTRDGQFAAYGVPVLW
jgi:PIN domain nuclease of toxin-antitoxin system